MHVGRHHNHKVKTSNPAAIYHYKPHFTTINQSTIQSSINMPLTRRTHRTTATPRTARTTRSAAKPSLKTRLLGGGRRTHATTARKAPVTTTTTTTTRTTRTTGAHGHHATAAPVHHHKRHATMGDKVSGALMKLRGSLTRRPGLKVSRQCTSWLSFKHILMTIRLLALVACMALTAAMPAASTRPINSSRRQLRLAVPFTFV